MSAGRGLGLAVALAGATAWWAWNSAGPKAHEAAHQERLSCALPAPPAAQPHPGMVWVPGGEAELGDNLYPEESPKRRLRLVGFWMDRTEVTNDEFAAFVRATGHVTVAERAVDVARNPGLSAALQQPGAVVFVMPNEVRGHGDVSPWWRYTPGAQWRHPGGPHTHLEGRGSFPVVAITIDDALAYARWKGRTLPSEAQWEWAARGASNPPLAGQEAPAQANTWQGLFPVVNTAQDGFIGLAPVGCYAPNGLGLYDMIGNVWELTTDAWTPHPGGAEPSPPDQAPGGLRAGTVAPRVIKGGSYLCAPNYCMRYRAGARQPQEADLAVSHLGFRTLLVAPGP